MRWLNQEYATDLNPVPPAHMPIAFGPVTAKVKKHKEMTGRESTQQTPHEGPERQSGHNKSDSDEECVSLAHRLRIKLTQPSTSRDSSAEEERTCRICFAAVPLEQRLICPHQSCCSVTHLICLAKKFLKNEPPHQLLPVEGHCPACERNLLWGDLVRHSQGFHQYVFNDVPV